MCHSHIGWCMSENCISPSISPLPDKDVVDVGCRRHLDRSTFPLLSLLLRLTLLPSVNLRKSQCRATWQLKKITLPTCTPTTASQALFDQDKPEQGREGEGEKRLQRQRNMFATYSFFYPHSIHVCQMAIAKFLNCGCLALWA